MSRKQDVIVLFEFLIELLKEKEEITPVVEESKMVIPEPVIDEAKKKLDRLFDPEEVRHLMQRVDEMDKAPTFVTNPILGDQQRNFEAEFKKMVTQVDTLTKEKEKNDRDNELDATAKSDFDVIKTLRNTISSEEKAAARPAYGTLEEIFTRTKTGISFSG